MGTAALVLLGATLSGCADPDEPTAGSGWEAEIAQAVESATSDLEREILADGEITAVENNEAHQMWLACMQQTFPPGGVIEVSLEPQSDGSYAVSAMGFDAEDTGLALFEATMDECAIGTTAVLAPLYQAMTTNPENTSPFESIAECLVRNGAKDPGYSGDDFAEDISVGPEDIDEFLEDERVAACMVDPDI